MASSSSYVALGASNWIAGRASRPSLTSGSGPREHTRTRKREKPSIRDGERRMSGSEVNTDPDDQTRGSHSFSIASTTITVSALAVVGAGGRARNRDDAITSRRTCEPWRGRARRYLGVDKQKHDAKVIVGKDLQNYQSGPGSSHMVKRA